MARGRMISFWTIGKPPKCLYSIPVFTFQTLSGARNLT
jgi:hypothetical protein